MNDRVRRLVTEIRELPDETARFEFIAARSRSDQSEVQRVMAPATRDRFLRFLETRSRLTDAQRREATLEEARRGKATSVADMVEVLLENRERLRPADRTWVQDIEATAASLVGIAYTPRQEQVIRDIYFRYYAGAS